MEQQETENLFGSIEERIGDNDAIYLVKPLYRGDRDEGANYFHSIGK
jgi:hypothetical protein